MKAQIILKNCENIWPYSSAACLQIRMMLISLNQCGACFELRAYSTTPELRLLSYVLNPGVPMLSASVDVGPHGYHILPAVI